MKIAYLEICLRMEEFLEKKLKNIEPNSIISIAPKDYMIEMLEKENFLYDFIEITINKKTLTTKTNSQEFWLLIQQLEKRRTLVEIYERFQKQLRKTSPSLFEEEVTFPITPIHEYIIIIAVLSTVFLIVHYYRDTISSFILN